MLLEGCFVEPVLTKRAEHRRQTPDSPDETELPYQDVSDQAEVHFLCEFESRFSLTLHIFEWGATGEKIRDETAVAIGSVRLVAGFQGCL